MNEQQQHQASWQQRQEYAEQMQPLLGRLYRNKAIDILIYNRSLVGASVIDIIKAHRAVRHVEGQKLRLRETFTFMQLLEDMALPPMHLDIGKLAYAYYHRDDRGQTPEQYLQQELGHLLGEHPQKASQDVVLYGFGRIGRLLARLLIERQSPRFALRLRAIVVRGGKPGDLAKRASLLRRDSVHGPFNGSITIDEQNNGIIANGVFIQVIYASAPEEVDYQQYGIDNAIVVDNTGAWRDEQGLGRHLQASGVAKVLLTAPGKTGVKNIVDGVNHDQIDPTDRILSAASCTTNAITPTLQLMDEALGIVSGHVETVHSYTNDQNLIDNFHSAERRGRSAPLNMVITETGAAKAVAKAYPALEGKLTGNAIRVPTANVSLAILQLQLEKSTDKEGLNKLLRDAALFSPLHQQIGFSVSTEIVSSDLVGTRFAGVVDSPATIVSDNRATLYLWYDNEFGYSCQVLRVIERMADAVLPCWPLRQA